MAFSRGSFRAPAPARPRVAVFAVGRRLHVACAADRSERATLTDADDRPLTTLSDGAEVAILAWRPGWSGNTRYRVRVTDSGLEGWLPVGNLRGTDAASPSATSAPPTSAVPSAPTRGVELGDAGRPFGRRRW